MSSVTHINYLSDFVVEEHILDNTGVAIAPLSIDWEIEYSIRGNWRKYYASNKAGVLTNCTVDTATSTIYVTLHAHHLALGVLYKELRYDVSNALFEGGKQRTVVPMLSGIELVEEKSDSARAVESPFVAAYNRGETGKSAYDAAVESGYVGTEEEYALAPLTAAGNANTAASGATSAAESANDAAEAAAESALDAQEATLSANTAAQGATSATTSATTAASRANTAATNANSKATLANTAADAATEAAQSATEAAQSANTAANSADTEAAAAGSAAQAATSAANAANAAAANIPTLVAGKADIAPTDPATSAFHPRLLAVGLTYDATTKLYGYGGFSDITYDEALRMYEYGAVHSAGEPFLYIGTHFRVNFVPLHPEDMYGSSIALDGFAYNSKFRKLFLSPSSDSSTIVSSLRGFCAACALLTEIVGRLNLNLIQSAALAVVSFWNCVSLETVWLQNLKVSLNLQYCAALSAASVAYMINNSAATSAITITLHATAYARATADAGVQQALTAHPLVSIASA